MDTRELIKFKIRQKEELKTQISILEYDIIKLKEQLKTETK